MKLVKIGRFISQQRLENGLTQEALGEKLGVTNDTISPFLLSEHRDYWKSKWQKEHKSFTASLIVFNLCILGLSISAGAGTPVFMGGTALIYLVSFSWYNNRKAAYVEHHLPINIYR